MKFSGQEPATGVHAWEATLCAATSHVGNDNRQNQVLMLMVMTSQGQLRGHGDRTEEKATGRARAKSPFCLRGLIAIATTAVRLCKRRHRNRGQQARL